MRVNRFNAKSIIDKGMPQRPAGIEAMNAAGDIDPTTAGYDYAIRTTTYLAAKTVSQVFYELPLAEYIPIVEGEGSFMEDMRINRQFQTGGSFETSRVGNMFGQAKIGQIGIGNTPVTIKFSMFAEGYQWNDIDVQRAMASLRWDVIGGGMEALKKYFDLGVQKIAMLGLKDDLTTTNPTTGLYTMSGITPNLTTITSALKNLSAADFMTFVATVVADYRSNCSSTAWPNRFIMPESDYVGMMTAVSTSAALGSKKEYLENAFKALCGSDFKVLPCAYGNATRNAGYVSANGKNRYILYRADVDNLRMEHPIPFTMAPATKVGSINWETAAYQQVSGVIPIRPATIIYYDF